MGTTWLLSMLMIPLTVEGSKLRMSMPYMPAPTTPKRDLTDSLNTARKISAVTTSNGGVKLLQQRDRESERESCQRGGRGGDMERE